MERPLEDVLVLDLTRAVAVPITLPQSPWRFADADAGAAPGVVVGDRGQHNREVLRDLAGLDDGAIDALEDEGIVSAGEAIRRPNASGRR